MGSAVRKVGGAVKKVATASTFGVFSSRDQGGGGGGISPTFNPKQARADIAGDIAEGQRVLGKDFEEGSLGRLGAGRSGDIQRVIEGRRAQLGGISAEENQALRERGVQGIERGTQTAIRRLRGIQGASGVRGATAAAQVGRQLSAGQQAKAGVERDLLIRNIQERREALGGFEEAVTGAEQTEQQREIFNLQQASAEKFARQTAGLGFAQLGVTARTGATAANVAAASAAQSGGGGKK